MATELEPCSANQDHLPFAPAVPQQEPQVPPPPVPTYSTHTPTYNSPSAPPMEQAEATEVDYECPVCFDSIEPQSATMRCDGSGGRCHYFHAHCLNSWIHACQQQGNSTNCPVCRGSVEIHGRRLEQFLQTTSATDDSTTIGRQILQSLTLVPERMQDGWAQLPSLTDITTDEIVAGATVLAGAGIGFWAGASGTQLSTGSWMMDSQLWERSSTSTRVATVVGYTSGVVYRWWSSNSRDEEETEEDRRRRRRRQNDRR